MILTELFGKADDADFFTDSAGILSNPFSFLLHLLRIDTARSFAISVASLTSAYQVRPARRGIVVYILLRCLFVKNLHFLLLSFFGDVKNMQNFRKEEKRTQDSAYCRQEKINVRRKRYDN